MSKSFIEEINEITKKDLNRNESDLIKQNLSAEELFVLLLELSYKYNVDLCEFIDTELTIENIERICNRPIDA